MRFPLGILYGQAPEEVKRAQQPSVDFVLIPVRSSKAVENLPCHAVDGRQVESVSAGDHEGDMISAHARQLFVGDCLDDVQGRVRGARDEAGDSFDVRGPEHGDKCLCMAQPHGLVECDIEGSLDRSVLEERRHFRVMGRFAITSFAFNYTASYDDHGSSNTRSPIVEVLLVD